MRLITLAIALITLCWNTVSVTADTAPREKLIFEGVVMRIGPSPNYISGRRTAYQLVKYRVERVCSGSYNGTEIVVDHLILCQEQLRGLKVGDKVCVTVFKSKTVNPRYNAVGIRAESDPIDTFYIGGGVSHNTQVSCSCGEELLSPCRNKNISKKRIVGCN